MKKIRLSQNKCALVDDKDYNWLIRWRWFADQSRHTHYVIRNSRTVNGNRETIRMHRAILGLKPGDSKEVDHVDGNGLNNQRVNLRICTSQQNRFNQKSQTQKTSRFRGVSWKKQENKWRAQIHYNCKVIYLGSFTDEGKAAKAYNEAAKKHFGEFARLNTVTHAEQTK